jgi:hypothetical protein
MCSDRLCVATLEAYVENVMIYGAVAWTLTSRMCNKLLSTEREFWSWCTQWGSPLKYQVQLLTSGTDEVHCPHISADLQMKFEKTGRGTNEATSEKP